MIAAGMLTTLKIVVGALTGSLGILSEAAHSGLDLVAAALTYFSVRVADKPADSAHPFGHGKVEHLSAFVQTALLLATCAWITVEAIRRLFFREVPVEPSVWAFGVMLVSITIDDGADSLHDIARGGFRGSDVNHHIRVRENFPNAGLHLTHNRLGVFQRDVASECQPEVHEEILPALPDADALVTEDARHTANRTRDPVGHAFGRSVHERIHRSPAQPQADVNSNPGYH